MTCEDNIIELIGDVFCINETYNKERYEFASGHRYNPRPIHVCKKCKAWTLVQNFPFVEQAQFPLSQSPAPKKIKMRPNKEQTYSFPNG